LRNELSFTTLRFNNDALTSPIARPAFRVEAVGFLRLALLSYAYAPPAKRPLSFNLQRGLSQFLWVN